MMEFLYSVLPNTPQLAAWVPRCSKIRPEGKIPKYPVACWGDRNFRVLHLYVVVFNITPSAKSKNGSFVTNGAVFKGTAFYF